MDNEQFKLRKVICMIMIPTMTCTGLYIGTGLHFQKIPSLLLFFLFAVISLFPLELAMILKESRRKYGKYSLKSALIGQENSRFRNAIIPGLLLFAYAGICNAVILPLEEKLMEPLSGKISAVTPVFFQWDNLESILGYQENVIYITLALYFICNVIIGPVVEELFFRGFLTQKIMRFGKMAPVIITVLFSLYHLWLPFQNLFRIAVFLPASYLTWKKKNLYISIVFHCTCNLFSTVSFLFIVLSK